MSYLRISEAKNSSFPLLQIQSKKTCAIQCALCLITLIGLTLSILAIVSYVPRYAGYCGGGGAVASLIAMAIIHVSRSVVPATRNRASSTSLEEPNTIPGSNTSNTVAAVPVRSSIEELASEISTHIFSYLDPESLVRVGRTCRTLSTIAKQDQLWRRHCRNQFIPITDSKKAKECFLEAKNFAHRLTSISPKETHLNNNGLYSVLLEKDRVFIGFTKRVEVWDPNLTQLINTFELAIENPKRLKTIGNTLFCIEELPKQNRLYLVRCDLKTTTMIDDDCITFTLRWWQASSFSDDQTRLLEISEHQAFVNHKDGSIRIWDLRLDYGGYDDNMDETDYKAFLERIQKELPSSYENQKRLVPAQLAYQSMVKNCKFLRGHTAKINQLLISHGYLFSSSEDGTIKQWDIEKHECIQTISTDFASGVDFFTVQGNYIFGYSLDRSTTHCRLWDLTIGEWIHSFSLKVEIRTCCVKGNLLFFGNKNTLHVYDMSRCEEIKTFQTEEAKDIEHIQVVDKRIVCQFRSKIIVYDF